MIKGVCISTDFLGMTLTLSNFLDNFSKLLNIHFMGRNRWFSGDFGWKIWRKDKFREQILDKNESKVFFSDCKMRNLHLWRYGVSIQLKLCWLWDTHASDFGQACAAAPSNSRVLVITWLLNSNTTFKNATWDFNMIKNGTTI